MSIRFDLGQVHCEHGVCYYGTQWAFCMACAFVVVEPSEVFAGCLIVFELFFLALTKMLHRYLRDVKGLPWQAVKRDCPPGSLTSFPNKIT
eukprot:5783511-Amphidinium_carterae.1